MHIFHIGNIPWRIIHTIEFRSTTVRLLDPCTSQKSTQLQGKWEVKFSMTKRPPGLEIYAIRLFVWQRLQRQYWTISAATAYYQSRRSCLFQRQLQWKRDVNHTNHAANICDWQSCTSTSCKTGMTGQFRGVFSKTFFFNFFLRVFDITKVWQDVIIQLILCKIH